VPRRQWGTWCFVATAVGRLPTASTDHDELRWVTAAAEAAGLQWATPDLSMVGKLAILLA
jgi:8-oxo-dGTP diphosphatase